MRGIELVIALEVEGGLQRSGCQRVVDLRPGAHDAGLEGADVIAGATVGADLIVDVADDADVNLFRHGLRRSKPAARSKWAVDFI
jgi:hypothetical protein